MRMRNLLAAGIASAAISVTVPAVASADDAAEGGLPNGAELSPFDMSSPAVSRLDPALLDAVARAATGAAADGITLGLTSGWRSPEFQQRLFDDAVAQY